MHHSRPPTPAPRLSPSARPLPAPARPTHRAIALAALALVAGLALPGAGPARAADTSASGGPTWPDGSGAVPSTVQQVVVTASRHAGLMVDAPAALSVVTAQDIAERGADNLLDAVRGEPGLSLQGRAVHGRKVLAMRGLDSRHTLFLVDGLRISASDGTVGASDFQYDWLSTDDIQRIEVVRGPLSVLYGSEALGGVVQVITRPVGEHWRGRVHLEASAADGGRGGDGWRSMVGLDGPLSAPAAAAGGQWTLRLGASGSELGAVASATDPQISELEARRKTEGWLQLGWRDAVGRAVTLQHRSADEHRSADARERSGAKRYHVTDNDLQRQLTALDWQGRWGHVNVDGADWETQLRIYRSEMAASNTRSNGVTPNLPQTLHDDVLDAQARHAIGPHDLTGGTEWRREALADPGLPGGHSSANHRAAYLQDEWAVQPNLTLTLGLRVDHHEQYGSEWSPRLYGVWKPAPHWVVKGGFSHGFKAPNLKQIAPGSRAEGPNTVIGEPNLQPERSDSLELGAGWQQGDWQWQAMAFDQRVSDLIDLALVTPGAVPGLGTYIYQNIASARMRGLELGGQMPLPTWAGVRWQLGAQYTYLDARDGNDQRLIRRPRHSATLRLNGQAGPWHGGLAIEHTGRQSLPSGRSTADVRDTTLLSAQIRRDLGRDLSLTLGVRNLGNLSLAEASPLFTQAEPPRTWRLALQGRW